MISCFQLKPCVKCFLKLVLKGFKLKKLGVEPKNGSTGRPIVLVQSSTGRMKPKSLSLSKWPSLPGRGDSFPNQGQVEVRLRPNGHLPSIKC